MAESQTTDLEKKRLRREKLILRDFVLSEEKVQRDSEKIFTRVCSLKEFQEADAVLLYASYRHEVDTERLREHCFKKKKTVAYPKVICKGEMTFYIVEKPEELMEGYQGIKEPDAMGCRLFCEKEFSQIVVIVPGAAFDRRGYRIGYGGGYYDRYLSKLQKQQLSADHMSGTFNEGQIYPGAGQKQTLQVRTIALCLSEQLCDRIPAEPTDIPVDVIVTPEEIIRKTEEEV